MAVLPIRIFPDPVLKEKAVPVEGVTAEVAAFIDDAIKHKDDDKALKGIAEQVKGLCARFPVYPGFEK